MLFHLSSESVNPGEELCTNYIDDFETNYNTQDVRREVLSGWHFTCMCSVCSLSGDELELNNNIRWFVLTLITQLLELKQLK